MAATVPSQLLANLRPSDTFRLGNVVELKGINRIIFAVKEFFAGGWAQRDRAAFKDYYSTSLQERLAVVKHDLENKQNLDKTLPELKNLLQAAAKISNSSWADSLKKGKSKEYSHFNRELTFLRKMAAPLLSEWATQTDRENRGNISRWINANDSQRRFASFLNMDQVPYKFEEIPKGSVMITDPEAYLLNRRLNGMKSIWKTIIVRIKAFICRFFTGMRFTHAELSLGKGESFDLDKRKGVLLRGEGVIQKRAGKAFYGCIMAPNQEAMLEAYNKRFPDQPLASFDDLWTKIEADARAGARKIKVNFWDVFKTGLIEKRPADYNCTLAWNPGVNKYSCSATVSSLFSKFGIDIGAQFSRIDKNITPVDYFHSNFFKPLYIIP